MRYIRNRRAKTNRTASNLAFDAVHGPISQKKAKKIRPAEKQGITIPRSIRHAMMQNLAAVGTPLEGKWGAAITNEWMDSRDYEFLNITTQHQHVSTAPKDGNSHRCTWFSMFKLTVVSRLDSAWMGMWLIARTTQHFHPQLEWDFNLRGRTRTCGGGNQTITTATTTSRPMWTT
jgi:hypothetical protein